MIISYAGLDISTSAGAELLYQRIRSAARTVFEARDWDERVLSVRNAWRKCYQGAISNPSPPWTRVLLDVHREKAGRDPHG